MPTAIFLHIDADVMQSRLEALEADRLFERLERVHVYDYPDLRLSKGGAWLRLHNETERVVLSYRERLSEAKENHHHKAEEVDIQLDSFNGMNFVLEKIGLGLQFIEEKRRIQYKRGGVQFTIEYLPALQPYIEIVAPNDELLLNAAAELELNPEDGKKLTTFQIYQEAGINVNEYSELSFAHMKKRQA